MSILDQSSLKQAYQDACEIELQAFKPGNVSVFSEGHEMTVEQFRLSAQVSSEPISNPEYSLGEKIYYAVKATREAVACNTNLGIVLLAAPLLQAMQQRVHSMSLHQALTNVLDATTIKDAEWVFRAIALASPGGLGDAADQDVKQSASVTLIEAMVIAAERDKIAEQYKNYYKDVFEFTVPEYNRAFVLSGESNWSALSVFCTMLARYPDSHIERKYGKQYSAWIAAEMLSLTEDMKTVAGLEHIYPKLCALDKAFKSKKINPGTTADITVATVLVTLLEQLVNEATC
jgi:triphosphoribosyl-dephospho-CoA synthase